MAKEEIVEGLRQAVSKGEPLEKATASFFNAGYSRGDIEEAARVLQAPNIFQQQFQQPMQKIPFAQPAPISAAQRVSDYGKPPSRTTATITIVLFSLLLLLLGIRSEEHTSELQSQSNLVSRL